MEEPTSPEQPKKFDPIAFLQSEDGQRKADAIFAEASQEASAKLFGRFNSAGSTEE